MLIYSSPYTLMAIDRPTLLVRLFLIHREDALICLHLSPPALGGRGDDPTMCDLLVMVAELQDKQSQHFIPSSKKVWVNICSCSASASPDSRAATWRSSQCGHNSESTGGEINCTNLPLDNTMRGWWKRMRTKVVVGGERAGEREEEKLEGDRSRHLGRRGLDRNKMQPHC